jgi:hypothetical protein
MTDSIDRVSEELQVYIDALEAQCDEDDNEITAYARARNRVQGDREAVIARQNAEHAKIDANAAKMLKACDNRDSAIEWKWGRLIQDLVYQKTKGGKSRFVDTLFGRCGFRKTPERTKRIFRDGCDKATSLTWAKKNYPSAVRSNTTEWVVLSELPGDCSEIWDKKTPPTDKFYWTPAKKEKNDERA